MAWALSAETQLDEANTLRTSSTELTPDPASKRSRTSASNGPEAPLIDPEPTSSWSNSAATLTCGPGSASTRAEIAAQHDTWLSSRPLEISDRSAPSTAAGC